jgi:hypothetical protein
MQPECYVQGGCELSLHQDTADLRGQRAVANLLPVNSAKDDRSPGENFVSVLKQKLQRWSDYAYRDIDFRARIFRSKEIA